MEQPSIIQFENLSPEERKGYQYRKTARAVVFDENNKIALLYVSKHNYHKLPGGGAEDGEDLIVALKRECVEEIGCDIEVIEDLGASPNLLKKN